jgi:hypothetical protein
MPLNHDIQLIDSVTGRALAFDGHFAVCPTGDYNRTTLYDDAGATLSGATQAINKGKVRFNTAESVSAVDIYGYTSNGYAFQAKNVPPGGLDAIRIDTLNLRQTLLIPLHYTDLGAAAAEYDTGFDLVKDVAVLPWGVGLYVAAVDATETIDVGTDSTSGANDPNGFFAALSLATLGFQYPEVGYVIGTNSIYADLTGGTAEWTYGELFHPATTKQAKAEGTDSATTKNGMYLMKPHIPSVGGSTAAYTESVTATASSGTDTFKGILILPTQLYQPASF